MTKRLLGVVILFISSCTALCFGQTTTKPVYSVEAVRYGTLKDFAVSGLVAGADKSRKMDIAMVYWLVRGNGHNILVDAGFYRPQFFVHWKVADFQKPSDALLHAGLKPEEITDIIITHMHWDHADGFDLFPKARIWIQRDEYTYYTGEAWASKDTHVGIDPDDVLTLVNLDLAGRVSLVPGDNQEIIPGVTCYTGGRHTYASQYVAIHTAKGVVVLASDNVYVKENLSKHVPITATLDAQSNLRAQDRMKGIASNVRFIISGHDPAVFSDFPAVGDGVVKIE